MIYSKLPTSPHERRLIVPMDGPSLTFCESTLEGRKTIHDPEVACLVIAESHGQRSRSGTIEAELLRRGQLRNQEVLVQSAFRDDAYFALDEAADKLALEKLHLTIDLCQILGATSVVIEELTLKSRGSKVDLKVAGERLDVSGELTASQEEVLSAALSKTSAHEFIGGEADVTAAEMFMGQYKLDEDLGLASLARLRSRPNTMRKRALSFSTKDEAKRSRDLALKVGIPFAQVSAAVETVRTEATEYQFKFAVEFDR